MSLNPKQERFVEEYLVHLNATQAYMRAYPDSSPEAARTSACDLLANPKVQEAVAEAKARRAERMEITQDRVLLELARLAFVDVRKMFNPDGTAKQVTELDDDTAAAIVGLEIVEQQGEGGEVIRTRTRKLKVADKSAALANAMRHLGMLKDRVEHTGKDGGPIETTMSNNDLARRIAFVLAQAMAARTGADGGQGGTAC